MENNNYSYWNNRILRKKDGRGEYYFEIHEVYYDGNDKLSWNENPKPVVGIDVEDLKLGIEQQLRAFNLPVLEEWGDTLREVK